MKRVVNVRDMEKNTVRRSIICLIRVPEGEKREDVAEEILETLVADNFPEVKTETSLPIQNSL